ncbi:MAG: carbohydrate porin [Victivallaceae bacterium]
MRDRLKSICKLTTRTISLVSAIPIIMGAIQQEDSAESQNIQETSYSSIDTKVTPHKELHPEHKLYKKIKHSNRRMKDGDALPEAPLETRVVDPISPYNPQSHNCSPQKNCCNYFSLRNPKNCSYSLFKKKIQNCTNTEYSLDISILPQYAHSNIGPKKVAWQTMYNPSVNWELFNNKEQGAGSIQFSYILVRYWGNEALTLGNRIGIAGGINDFTSNTSNFNQLTYTQVFPNDKFSAVVGQYSLYAIDGTTYDNDQQTGFISYALSQNGSATYSLGSLGAYGQINLTPQLMVQAGFQDAFNINGVNIDFLNLSKNKYNTFFYTQWNPSNRCGPGQYSFLVYNTRAVPQQKAKTTGWSFNFSQNVSKKVSWFGRANGASGNALPIKRSFVLGVAADNPCNRNNQDLIGLAMAVNAVSPKGSGIVNPATTPIRSQETVIETFCTIGFGPYISLSPDFQFYIHPAREPKRNTAVCYGLRTNITL